MAITLKKLCNGCELKYEMKLIAGKNGINNTVRWVHMVEDSQVPDFLHGNELVFTTGIGHINDDNRLNAFIHNLKQNNAAGAVINLGPYISHIPESVIYYCNENDFPLFTLPWKVHIIDITHDFCSKIIENEKNELTLADAFKKIIKNINYMSEYRKIFDEYGFKDNIEFRVIAIDFYKDNQHATEYIVHNNIQKLWRVLTNSQSPATIYVDSGHLIVITQGYSLENILLSLKKLEKICNLSNIDFFIGLSDEHSGFDSVSNLFKQAKAALINATLDNNKISQYSDIGIDKLICEASDFAIKSYIDSTIGFILDYDRENHTDFFKVLRCYIENDCSLMAVSEIMGVHRNTVNYKISKIKELFNLKLNETEKAKFIFAFRILKLNEKEQLL